MRLPPHSLDHERALLALGMSGAMSQLDGAVQASDFYAAAHQIAWDAMARLASSGQPVDGVTLRHALASSGTLAAVGGDEWLLSLGEVPIASDADVYARTVRDLATRRRVISTLNEYASVGYDNSNPTDVYIGELEAALSKAADSAQSVEVSDSKSSLVRFWERATRVREAGGLIGVRSGIASLDAMIGGFWCDELTTLGGRPSMGKTALLETCAVNALSQSKRVLFFSLEMSEGLLWPRILAKVCDIDASAIKDQTLTRDGFADLERAMKYFQHAPFRIIAKPGLTIGQIRSIVRKESRTHGVDIVFVDYLQKVRGTVKHERRDLEIGEVSTGLAELARELSIPVVVGAQVNRGVANRADKRPMPSDLRESGSIENDSDAIVLIHREAYYRQEQILSGERDVDGGETVDAGAAELIVGKNRNGPTGVAHCRYAANRCLFHDG